MIHYHYDKLWSWYTMLRDDTRSSFGKQRQQSMVKVDKFSLETLERWRAPARSFQRIEAPAVHQIRRACWECTSEEVRRNSAYLGKGQRLSVWVVWHLYPNSMNEIKLGTCINRKWQKILRGLHTFKCLAKGSRCSRNFHQDAFLRLLVTHLRPPRSTKHKEAI